MFSKTPIILNTKRAIWFLAFVWFIVSTGYAQSNYQAGWLPAFNMNKSLKKDFKLNFKIESRQEFKSGFFEESSSFNYDYVLTDFSVLGVKKVAIDKSAVFGYLLRLRDGEVSSRLIQQFIVVQSLDGHKLAHRFAADQTFSAAENPTYRLRYRISFEIPLNGQSLDENEFYLKLNNEYLNSWQSSEYDLELRLIPFLGYKFSDTEKLEIGIDYRLNSFLEGSSSHRFWLGFNWYQVI